jgi:hypothetical protein
MDDSVVVWSVERDGLLFELIVPGYAIEGVKVETEEGIARQALLHPQVRVTKA